jgi:hypothetical protein
MSKTRWLFTCEAMHPTNHTETWEVGAQEAKLKLLAKSGHEHKLARLALVKAVVADPVMIVGGWNRPDKDSCYVYAGTPEVDVIGARIEVPAPPGMFFLAFIHPDGTIDDWVWRPTSELDPTGPDGINGEVLWPKQPT